jgi:hypothetical protein
MRGWQEPSRVPTLSRHAVHAAHPSRDAERAISGRPDVLHVRRSTSMSDGWRTSVTGRYTCGLDARSVTLRRVQRPSGPTLVHAQRTTRVRMSRQRREARSRLQFRARACSRLLALQDDEVGIPPGAARTSPMCDGSRIGWRQRCARAAARSRFDAERPMHVVASRRSDHSRRSRLASTMPTSTSTNRTRRTRP